jgi:hypothetical protein
MRAACRQMHDELLKVLVELSGLLRLSEPDLERLAGMPQRFAATRERRREVMDDMVYPRLFETLDECEAGAVRALCEHYSRLVVQAAEHARAWPDARIRSDWRGFCAAVSPIRIAMVAQLFDEQTLLYPLIDRHETIRRIETSRP